MSWLWPMMVVWAAPAVAGEAVLDLDTKDLQVGQAVSLAVRVIDSTPTAVPRVEAPDGVRITYRAQSQSLRQTVYAGQARSTVAREYLYRLEALQEGVWTVPAVTVDVGTGTLTTEPATVRVTPAVQTEGGQDVWVESQLTPTELYEGQMTTFRYALRSRARVLRYDWTLPPMDCLVQPSTARDVVGEYTLSDPAGDLWTSVTEKPLVATQPCQRNLAGAVATARVSRIRERSRRRDPLMLFPEVDTQVKVGAPGVLTVKPLPQPVPADFSGLVGDFAVRGQLEDGPVQVGQSLDWLVTISGDGLLDGFELPDPGELDGLQRYDGSPAIRGELVDGTWDARAQINRVLVPTRPGTLVVPDIELVTFSPSTGEYVRHRLEGATLQVKPGAEGVDADLESYLANEDPQTTTEPEPEPLVKPVRQSGMATRLTGAWFWGLLGLAALPGALWWVREGATALRALVARRRRPAPVREATPLERLEQLPQGPVERLAALDAALRAGLAASMDVGVAQLDRDAAMAALPEELAERVRALTRELDRVRFAGGAPRPELESEVRAVLTALEGRRAA